MATSTIQQPTGINMIYPTKTNGSKWTSGTISIRRRGDVCQIKLDGAVFSAISARETIATVPEGYRPSTETYFLSADGSRSFLITAGGDLKANAQSASTVWGTGMYLVA